MDEYQAPLDGSDVAMACGDEAAAAAAAAAAGASLAIESEHRGLIPRVLQHIFQRIRDEKVGLQRIIAAMSSSAERMVPAALSNALKTHMS